MLLRIILIGSFTLLTGFATPAAELPQEPPAKRLSAIVGVAVEEYGKGIDAKGQVTSATELEEAAGFLKDAQDVAKRLTTPKAVLVRTLLDSLAAAADQRATPARLSALHQRFVAALGAEGAIDLPTRAIDIARGKAIFEQNCLACHGATGAGDGTRSKEFTPRPAAIGSPSTMHDRSPALMYRIVSVGIQGTMMPSWADQLSPDDRWNVVTYVNGLRATDAARAEGARLLAARCKTCATVGAHTARDLAYQMELSDDDLAARIAAGDTATGIAGAAPQELGALVAALRATPVVSNTVQAAATTTVKETDPRAAARATLRLIDDALAAAREGRSADAGDLSFDAYIAFEPLEGPARMRDPGLVAAMERHFADFKGAVKIHDMAAAEAERNKIEAGMPAVLELAAPTSTTWGLFLESFLIIVREGFEAILVLGAVVAFLIKTGNRKRLRDIWIGTGAGIAASFALAYVLKTFLGAVPASRDVIEGATMLVAVVVLFSVSYWLLSKVEGAKWQKFIREKVNAALSGGGSFALAFVAFLAVFREGAETALFYQALFTRVDHAMLPVMLGLGVGFAVLAVIFTLFHRFGVKIPLRPFFAVTSALLYYMAFVFAGKGVKELQEGNVISQSLIPGFPHIDAIGLYPTVETLLAQGILVVLLLFALWKTLTPSAADEQEDAGAPSVPPEVAARLAELQATARRLQDRVDSLEKEIDATTPAR
jgi:high-affinity iron transporter